jgi:hypothetical protein
MAAAEAAPGSPIRWQSLSITSIRSTTVFGDFELLVFETCAHAPIYQSTAEFNEKTLSFLNRHTG